jgi:hypothetical protein
MVNFKLMFSQELYAMLRAYDVYLLNPEFMKPLLKFCGITCLSIFSLNNKKYNRNCENFKDFSHLDFVKDFNRHIDTTDTIMLSTLPVPIVKNIIQIALLCRNYNAEILSSDMYCTKLVSYFSLIYSSNVELINNPHLRSEILDIMIYLFRIYDTEKFYKQASIVLKLLYDAFIIDNLIVSLMRVFIDAERLGTANQFFEKYSVRNKLFYLLENVMKCHKSIYIDKIIDYANVYSQDITKMINLLMNDLTYLTDECFERLTQIKRYQDLIGDFEKFTALSEDVARLEREKFETNDRVIKTEIQVLTLFKFSF